LQRSDVDIFGDLQGVVDVDAEIGGPLRQNVRGRPAELSGEANRGDFLVDPAPCLPPKSAKIAETSEVSFATRNAIDAYSR